MPARKLPDNKVLLDWLNQGLTHEQIRQLVKEQTGHDVAPSAIRVAVSRLGAAGRRPRYGEWVPWTVTARHNKAYPLVMLRAYARYEQSGRKPESLSDDLRVRLFNWLAQLTEKNVVVDYDPATGFTYVPAKPGEQVIRRPVIPTKPARRTA